MHLELVERFSFGLDFRLRHESGDSSNEPTRRRDRFSGQFGNSRTVVDAPFGTTAVRDVP